MRKQLFLFVFVLSLALGVPAQRKQNAEPHAKSDPETNIRKHIAYLASDKLEGRRTGEPGALTAAGYVANMFANYKLKPGARGKNGRPSYMQSYPYVTGINPATSRIRITLTTTDSNGKATSVSEPFGFLPVGYSTKGNIVNAPVSFAGYGVVSKDPNFDDYAWQDRQMDFKGDVVVVFDGNPDNDNPHSAYARFDVRTKALIAKEHGAVAMLVISREPKFTDDRLTRMTYDQSLGETAVPTFVISREVARDILGLPNEASLKNIEDLVAKKKDGINTNVGFRDVSPRLTFELNLVKQSVEAYNVVGMIEGTDRALRNEAVVIGAHYDHLGHGGQGSLAANSTEVHHGADDNASGTAAIIELARQFSIEKKNKRTIIFIAFSGEEEGLFGSSYYVQNPVFPLDKTVAMINLDMVGRLKDSKLDVGGIGTASEFKSLVEASNQVRRALETTKYSIGPNGRSTTTTTQDLGPASVPVALASNMQFNPALPGRFSLQLSEDGYGPSDHSSFYSKKVPVLFFFTGTHNDYHKPSDTADKINYTGEVDIINYVAAIERSIDQNTQRPTYTVAKSSGTGGRATFNISLGTIPNYADSTDGLLLDGVRDGSPADKGGVKAGDKVVKLAGHDIRNVMDYTYVLGEMKADIEYEIVVLRGTERLTLKVTPVKRP